MTQICGFLADTGKLVPGCIIGLKDLWNRRKLLRHIIGKMGQRECCKFLWLWSVKINNRCESMLLYSRQINRKLRVKMQQKILRIFFGGDRWIHFCQRADLFCSDRTDPGKACIDCFWHRHRFPGQMWGKFFKGHGQRICLGHRVWYKIIPSGKNLTYRTHLCGNVLDTVNDLSVLWTKDNIAVLSHDLYDQFLPAEITQFVQMLNLKVNDPFQSRLINVDDSATTDMLSQ